MLLYKEDCGARAAIYADRNLNLWRMDEFTTRDMATCQWELGRNETVIVTSVYMDIENPQIWPAELKSLI